MCTGMHTSMKTHMQAYKPRSSEAKDKRNEECRQKRQEVRQTDMRKTKHTRKETNCVFDSQGGIRSCTKLSLLKMQPGCVLWRDPAAANELV